MKKGKSLPPGLARKLLHWYARAAAIEDIDGDVEELFFRNLEKMSRFRAGLTYWAHVCSLLFSYALKRRKHHASWHPYHNSTRHHAMVLSNLKITWRTMLRNKFSSVINVGGLSLGMAVAILIGLWVWDEMSFDKYHTNYKHIANVKTQSVSDATIQTSDVIPLPLEAELKLNYAGDFKHIVMCTIPWSHALAAGDTKISVSGSYIGLDAPEMFSIRMVAGTRDALKDLSAMLISQGTAKALFGKADPMGKVIKIDNNPEFKVAGVYEDLPLNSSLHDIQFMAPWDFYKTSEDWLVNRAATDWSDNFLLLYVEMNDAADMKTVGEKIRDLKKNHVEKDQASLNPTLILHPMERWHLYGRFVNGIDSGGAIEYVKLFAIIGLFVLLLACINFMNLSTARSEKRARETGIRKAIGSAREQLINQFLSESLFVAFIAFSVSLLFVIVALPFFNTIAEKQIDIPFGSLWFWTACTGFTMATGLVAGSYPAFYLSSFQPVKVLKGTFKAGKSVTLPRRILVVIQFTVSVILIVGTIVVFGQIEYAKNRPVGYTRNGLVTIETSTNEIHKHIAAARAALIQSGAVTEIAQSSSPTTGVNNNGLLWKGKDPSMTASFGIIRVSMDYGKTVGWDFVKGRDFSSDITSDSLAVVVNEAAVKYMKLSDPVNEIMRVGKRDLKIIGVIKDMVMESPFSPVRQTIYYVTREDYSYLNARLNPEVSPHESLRKLEAIYKDFAPSDPFSFKFADDDYARKFSGEERIGKLAGFFALLAILISCIGLFGMASFMAGQRVKELGVRKVMGASEFQLWALMTRDFVAMVLMSLLIAIPVAWYLMKNWVSRFAYHTELSGWAFAWTAIGAIVVTMVTVSYQSITAALANPVTSLRSE